MILEWNPCPYVGVHLSAPYGVPPQESLHLCEVSIESYLCQRWRKKLAECTLWRRCTPSLPIAYYNIRNKKLLACECKPYFMTHIYRPDHQTNQNEVTLICLVTMMSMRPCILYTRAWTTFLLHIGPRNFKRILSVRFNAFAAGLPDNVR